MTWKVELLDVFEHSWHTLGHYPSREEAVAVAKKKFDALQPPPGQPDPSGGPHPPGIQDRIFVIPPSGAQDGWQYLGDEEAAAEAPGEAPSPIARADRAPLPDLATRWAMVGVAAVGGLLLAWLLHG